MIVNATYVSVWDNGYEVATSCKFNKVTHEVTDIETSDKVEDFNTLNREFIRLDDGAEIDSFIDEEERIVINGEYIDEEYETNNC